MKSLLGVRDEEAISSFLKMLRGEDKQTNPYVGIMPPFTGNDGELKYLSKYLATINEAERAPSIGQAPASAPL